jgi:diadenosine tetraphosphatase ApaH/serine/threonine PP2A family protein phosphatase
VLAAPDRDELLDWLRLRPLLHVEGEYAMVHAGLLPAWSLSEAAALAAEVESALRAPAHRELYGSLYGSKPAAWSNALRGPERLRVIVNAMTRMRFCTPDGVMDFSVKGEVEKALPGYLPWFEVPGRRTRDVPIICGHWSALGLRIMPDLLALDTGCVWGGRLTAVRLEDRRCFRCVCPCGYSRGPDGPRYCSRNRPQPAVEQGFPRAAGRRARRPQPPGISGAAELALAFTPGRDPSAHRRRGARTRLDGLAGAAGSGQPPGKAPATTRGACTAR